MEALKYIHEEVSFSEISDPDAMQHAMWPIEKLFYIIFVNLLVEEFQL